MCVAKTFFGIVGTHPPTIFVDQPIDPFFTRPATTFLHVCIRARPIASLVSSLFNRPQGKNTSCSLAGWLRVDAVEGVCLSHPDKHFQLDQFAYHGAGFNLAKFLLFSVIESIITFI